MAQQIVELTCPGCGDRVTTAQSECKFCHKPIIISSFNSIYSMGNTEVGKYAIEFRKALSENPDNNDLNTSIAMCYLKLKLYDKALIAFEKAIEANLDNSETFFYAAICLLQGNKAFLAQRSAIDKIEEYINAALIIEPKAVYYYFWSYIKCDYYHRKYYNTTPSYIEALQMSIDIGISNFDKDQLFSILGVERPQNL